MRAIRRPIDVLDLPRSRGLAHEQGLLAALHIDRVDRARSWASVVRDPGPIWRPHEGVHDLTIAVLGTDRGPEIGLTPGRRVDEGHIVAVHDDEFVLGG